MTIGYDRIGSPKDTEVRTGVKRSAGGGSEQQGVLMIGVVREGRGEGQSGARCEVGLPGGA